VKLRPCGEAALLVELDDLAAVMALTGALEAGRSSMPAITDVVPAARTILVRFDPERITERAVATWLDDGSSRSSGSTPSPIHGQPPGIEISVIYDGPDLDEVGRLTGLGRDGVVAAHTGRAWTVAFLGFAPGFAYCTGGDPRLRVPRRDSPRQRVPAGAVGLADDLTAVYPRASPGGWQLIGHTEAMVWDPDRDPPALLVPGAFVRFRAA
jgi:KipI family sensor histidine kinase inhibitor